MDYLDLGMKIRQLRRQKSLTQEQLAEIAGISPSFLGHIERGTRVASVDTLVALCNALQVTPNYLLSASLNQTDMFPDALSSGQRARLSEFLRLAQDAVLDWDKRALPAAFFRVADAVPRWLVQEKHRIAAAIRCWFVPLFVVMQFSDACYDS